MHLWNLIDPCYSDAAQKFRVSDWIWEKYCSECQRACSTTNFLTTASSLSAPTDSMLVDIKMFVESLSIPYLQHGHQTLKKIMSHLKFNVNHIKWRIIQKIHPSAVLTFFQMLVVILVYGLVLRKRNNEQT